jgi:hypothetical protein
MIATVARTTRLHLSGCPVGIRRMKWIALLLLFCGCAAKTVLPPPMVSTADFEVGEFPNSLFLISYRGPAAAPSERLFDLALLKASQLAQERQLKYFVIIDQGASKPGEIKYRRTLPEPGDWNNELLIQGFKSRPHRVFALRANATEQAIYEKFRTAPEPETL